MKVLLDACVIYPTVMREMLLGVAAQGAFTPLWSARILEEWARAARKIGPGGEAQARGEIALLAIDWPEAEVSWSPSLEARLWLEEYLRRYKGTVLLVSHDRGLLNRVVGEILHLEQGKLKLYQGGYDRFEATRRMQLELNAKAKVKQDAQRAHIQKFVDRFRYKATKAKQAQSRIKMLARMEPIPEHLDEGSIPFPFPDPKPLAPPLYTADNVDIGYDGTAVLNDVSFRLDADDRIAAAQDAARAQSEYSAIVDADAWGDLRRICD